MFVTISGFTINTNNIQCYHAHSYKETQKYKLTIEFGKDDWLDISCQDQKELDKHKSFLDRVTQPITE